jgi:tRNA modification GTPase
MAAHFNRYNGAKSAMHFRVGPDSDQKHLSADSGASGVAAGETIAAISTPAGEGAISLVRIAGCGAVDVADRVFVGTAKPSTFDSHVQHVGEIRDGDAFIDQVVLSVHRAPASYTGEDLVEITCHGGVLVTARVLECCLRAGARAARPGEFTERAFLNGKMDLTQAEAVIDLIRAKTDLALRSATEQLEGRLGERIRAIRDQLVSIVAQVEASIDFPEEGIEADDEKTLAARLDVICRDIADLMETAEQGRMLREGVRVVIYGATNAGKSSLLNRLLGQERVIVSELPGTTRDTIEESINIRGFPIRLIDTAGFRSASDAIEREGIVRTERTLQQADLRLQVVDASLPRSAELKRPNDSGPVLLVLNKADLIEHDDWKDSDALRISCVTGEGFAQLEEEILARISRRRLHAESPVAINARHRACLGRVLDSCGRARESVDHRMAAEYSAVDLHGALQALGEIIGTVDTEQVLDSVFSQFCIGK